MNLPWGSGDAALRPQHREGAVSGYGQGAIKKGYPLREISRQRQILKLIEKKVEKGLGSGGNGERLVKGYYYLPAVRHKIRSNEIM